MPDFSSLDNPIWSALTSAHAGLALGDELARRYPRDVSPLAAVREATPAAFAALRRLVAADDVVWLLSITPLAVPEGWQLVRSRVIDQMVCEPLTPQPEPRLLSLGAADVPEMMALAARTEPGPFVENTIRMGSYWGIRSSDGRLAAMAGQRMQADGFIEVSAVCTEPEFRGRGYAKQLVESLTRRIQAQGKIAMLHVKTENGAKSVYEKIGYRVRCPVHFSVLAPR